MKIPEEDLKKKIAVIASAVMLVGLLTAAVVYHTLQNTEVQSIIPVDNIDMKNKKNITGINYTQTWDFNATGDSNMKDITVDGNLDMSYNNITCASWIFVNNISACSDVRVVNRETEEVLMVFGDSENDGGISIRNQTGGGVSFFHYMDVNDFARNTQININSGVNASAAFSVANDVLYGCSLIMASSNYNLSGPGYENSGGIACGTPGSIGMSNNMKGKGWGISMWLGEGISRQNHTLLISATENGTFINHENLTVTNGSITASGNITAEWGLMKVNYSNIQNHPEMLSAEDYYNKTEVYNKTEIDSLKPNILGGHICKFNSTTTETLTLIDTWYNISGFNASELNGFTFSNNALIPDNSAIYFLTGKISYKGAKDHNYIFRLAKNGVECKCREKSFTDSEKVIYPIFIPCLLNVTAGDTIVFQVKDLTAGGSDITVYEGSIIATWMWEA